MIIALSKSALLMLALSGAVSTTAAEAFLMASDEADPAQHVSQADAVKWATGVVPVAAEAVGGAMLHQDRAAFFALYAPSANISVPDMIGWAADSAERPAVGFTVRRGAAVVSHIPFTRSWSVVLPGVLEEQSGASAAEVSGRACARISFHDGKFRLDHLDFRLN
jgi:hypothetical protein